MAELRELYQEMIMEHNKSPRNFKVLANANRSAEGFNPLCGDRLTIYLRVESDRIEDVAFQGSGCAISKASASMLTTRVKGLTTVEARQLFERFHRMLAGGSSADSTGLEKLAVFSGVRQFPVRVKCATLAWHTLRAGLEGAHQVVTTEEESYEPAS